MEPILTTVKIKNRYDHNNSVTFFIFGNLTTDTDEIESWLKGKYPKNDYNYLYGRKFIRIVVLYIYILYYKTELYEWRNNLNPQNKNNNALFANYSKITNFLEHWQRTYLEEKTKLYESYTKFKEEGPGKNKIIDKFPPYLSIDPCELCFPWSESGREENRMFFPIKLQDVERKNTNCKELVV